MADSEQLWELVGLVRSKSPLVQCLTNYVSMDLMANGLLALANLKESTTIGQLKFILRERLMLRPDRKILLLSWGRELADKSKNHDCCCT